MHFLPDSPQAHRFCDFCAVHFFDTKMQPVTIRLYQLLLSCWKPLPVCPRALEPVWKIIPCNLHSTLCDIFHPEYPAFDNVPELVRYIGQLELMSEKMATNEALHSAPFDQFTSDTDRVFDSQEHNWNSSKKSSLQMENNHDLQTTKNSSGEATTFEESHNIFSQILPDSLLNGRPLPYYAPASSDDVPGTAHTRPVLYRAEAFPESGSGF